MSVYVERIDRKANYKEIAGHDRREWALKIEDNVIKQPKEVE